MPYGMSEEGWKRYKANQDHYQKGKLLKPYEFKTSTATGKTHTVTLYGTTRRNALRGK